MSLPHQGLYAVTPELTTVETLEPLVRLVLEGGARMVQFRDKSSDPGAREITALKLNRLCTEFGVPFIVNDDVELACAVEANGVHLGRDDVSVATARRALGAQRIIGVSCYNDPNLAMAALAEGADYIAYGSFFPSLTKPRAVRADLALVKQTRPRIPVPIAGIGGITADNAAPLVSAGINLLAVITDLFSAPDPKAAAQRFTRLFDARS